MATAAWREATRAQRAVVLGLVVAALGIRVVLAVRSPQPYGYVWDFYHPGVRHLYETGEIPQAKDCFLCWHPPASFVAGWPFYAVGRWVSSGAPNDDTALRWLNLLPLLCGAIVLWYGWRLVTLFGIRGWDLPLAFGLMAAFPSLVISSYGFEADIVLAAVLAAFIYYACVWWRDPGRQPLLSAARLGVLAGLAAATKYSGLAAVAAFLVLLALAALLAPGSRRRRTLAFGAVVLVVTAVVGGWRYVDNEVRYGRPLYARAEGPVGAGGEGFVFSDLHFDAYELSFRLGDVLELWDDDGPKGDLTLMPSYGSIPTTLHALAWTDMTFFSDPTRHGEVAEIYPRRGMPTPLVATILVLGLLPTALAVVGVGTSLRRRDLVPLAVISGVAVAAYTLWFLTQTLWALKTKYLLFLLPVMVVYAFVGLERLRRFRPLHAVLWAGLAVLVVIEHIYVLAFALGHL